MPRLAPRVATRDALALVVAALVALSRARAMSGRAFVPNTAFAAMDDASWTPLVVHDRARAVTTTRDGAFAVIDLDRGLERGGGAVRRRRWRRMDDSATTRDDDDDDDDDDDGRRANGRKVAFEAEMVGFANGRARGRRGRIGRGRGAEVVAAAFARTRRGREVLVVVGRDLRVVCFDADLREMWRRSDAVGEGDAAGFEVFATEASAFASARGAEAGDDGLIVVGARYERRRGASDARSTSSMMANDRSREKEMMRDEMETSAGRFEYFAFDVGTGASRWGEHSSEDDAHRAGSRGRASMKNLDDDEVIDARERSCGDFRESIVEDALPHQWRHPSDTKMSLAHFKRHKSRANAMKRDKESKNRRQRRDRDVVVANVATRTVGAAVDALRGTPMTRRAKRRARDARATSSDDVPNAIVSHHAEGVDILHLHSGDVICSLYLKSPGLHVDIDGDGVMDHVEAHGRGSVGSDLPACWATVTSGVPSEERALSASICRGGSGLSGHRLAQQQGYSLHSVEVTPPVSLQRVPETANELAKPMSRLGRDAIFLNSRGEMTCYDARDGEQRRWQIRTTADWNPGEDAIEPSLTSFSLHVNGKPDVVAAVGARSIVIVNAKGYRAAPPIALSVPPAGPLIVADVNGDGLNDIILRTRYTAYVWHQVPRSGSSPLAFLVTIAVVSMALAFGFARARDAAPGPDRDRFPTHSDSDSDE